MLRRSATPSPPAAAPFSFRCTKEALEIETFLARGMPKEYKAALINYAAATAERGSIHFIEAMAVPPKPAASGGGGGGDGAGGASTGVGEGPWDLRELCKELAPSASWDDLKPHADFKDLPVVNIDLLAHADPATRVAALEALVRTNEDTAAYLKTNPLTKDGNNGRGRAAYKPPQRHRGNQSVMEDHREEYRTPFLHFFRVGQHVPVGATDVGEVTYGTEPIAGVPDVPPAQKAEVEGALTDMSEFQVDRFNFKLFVDLLGEQVHCPSLTRDMFVRMHDGHVARVKEGRAKPQICYIDGASGSLPTLYIERSGGKGDGGGPGKGKGEGQGQMEGGGGKRKGKASVATAVAAVKSRSSGLGGGREDGGERGREGQGEEAEFDYDVQAAKLWFTRTHNEYGCLPFLNLMFAAGKEDEDLLSLLDKHAAAVLEAKGEDEGFKVWVFVLHDNGENLTRADVYAQQVHNAQGWHQFVDWREGGQTDFVVRVTDLLDHGVDVAVAIQRVGEMIVGGPGVGHGLVQHGTSLAVAVNICHLDLIHLPVRMATKGGDLVHRANRKTAGARPWYIVTADSVASIIRSLRDDLYRQMCLPPLPSSTAAVSSSSSSSSSLHCSSLHSHFSPCDRLKRLEADVSQLSTSLRLSQESMTKQGSSYSKTLTRQGWVRVIEGDFAQLSSALALSMEGGSPEAVVAILQAPLADEKERGQEEGGGHKEEGGGGMGRGRETGSAQEEEEEEYDTARQKKEAKKSVEEREGGGASSFYPSSPFPHPPSSASFNTPLLSAARSMSGVLSSAVAAVEMEETQEEEEEMELLEIFNTTTEKWEQLYL